MKQLTPRDLRAWLDDPTRPKPVLLDVRETWEYEYCHIAGSTLVPMRHIPANCEALDPNVETVVICHHGIRSYQVAKFLERQGFASVYNLTSGVEGWAREVDSTMRTY
jgi:rhodanese-related sulfurtransferase